jgi:WD40 repeat protein
MDNIVNIPLLLTLDGKNSGHKQTVLSVSFHPTARLVATCGDDRSIKIWHLLFNSDGVMSATCVATLDKTNGGHRGYVYSVVFHPTEPILASCSEDTTVKLWSMNRDGTSVTCVETLEVPEISVLCVALHPTKPFLASGYKNATVKLWRRSPGVVDKSRSCVATLDETNGGHSQRVHSVAFSPTGLFLVTGSNDNTVKLWRLSYECDSDSMSATCVATLNEKNGGHSNWVLSVVFHPSAPLFASGSKDKTVKLWRMSDDEDIKVTCVATLDDSNDGPGHHDSVRCVAFHQATLFLASSSNDHTVKLWQLSPEGSSATCMATLDKNNGGHRDHVTCVAFHPSAPVLATSSQDKSAKLWWDYRQIYNQFILERNNRLKSSGAMGGTLIERLAGGYQQKFTNSDPQLKEFILNSKMRKSIDPTLVPPTLLHAHLNQVYDNPHSNSVSSLPCRRSHVQQHRLMESMCKKSESTSPQGAPQGAPQGGNGIRRSKRARTKVYRLKRKRATKKVFRLKKKRATKKVIV